MASPSAPPAAPKDAADTAPREATSRIFPSLRLHEWILFLLLACAMAATNIYTTLLIGWSETGAIISALLSMLVLGALTHKKPSVFTINIGQSTASGGGAVGFAVATYTCVRLADPSFQPTWFEQMALFACLGTFGALVAATVRPMMTRYFFPTGTACAVIQKTVTRELLPGEKNRPLFLLKLWGAVASIAVIPTRIKLAVEDHEALLAPFRLWSKGDTPFRVSTDPLFYGIGLIVGHRVGLGMVLGGLLAPYVIAPALFGGPEAGDVGLWNRWLAIAVLTLPTFATIGLAYVYRTTAEVPPGFTAGRTTWRTTRGSRSLWAMVTLLSAAGIVFFANRVFGLPAYMAAVTMLVAWPMCIVNGRVNGDTDINPVRLLAVVILATLTFMIAQEDRTTTLLLGMAVIGGTMASVAVDMFQEYRTGHLLDADPVPMLSMQVVGAIAGAIVAIPVLDMLVTQLGVGPGEGNKLPAPGVVVWSTMGEAMAKGFHPSQGLLFSLVGVSLAGCVYAWLTIWPKTAVWMPSLFGIGIGMLLPFENSAAIFGGGLIHWVVKKFLVKGATPEERAASGGEVRNDIMLAGSAVFAASAIVSILLVIVSSILAGYGKHPFYIAG